MIIDIVESMLPLIIIPLDPSSYTSVECRIAFWGERCSLDSDTRRYLVAISAVSCGNFLEGTDGWAQCTIDLSDYCLNRRKDTTRRSNAMSGIHGSLGFNNGTTNLAVVCFLDNRFRHSGSAIIHYPLLSWFLWFREVLLPGL